MLQKLPSDHDAVLRALIESAPDGIVIVNQEGRMVLAFFAGHTGAQNPRSP